MANITSLTSMGIKKGDIALVQFDPSLSPKQTVKEIIDDITNNETLQKIEHTNQVVVVPTTVQFSVLSLQPTDIIICSVDTTGISKDDTEKWMHHLSIQLQQNLKITNEILVIDKNKVSYEIKKD